MVKVTGRSVHIGNGVVTIDGKVFNGDVSIIGNKVVVNGVEQDGELIGDISITVNGNCDSLETVNGNVTVHGSTGSVKTMSGDVTTQGDINGDVKTMSGDVKAKKITGRVSTMSGDVRGV